MKKILICGAGGFIGGHLASKFVNQKGVELICADIKPIEYWFQHFDKAENYSLDLKEYDNALKVTTNVDYIFIFQSFLQTCFYCICYLFTIIPCFNF